MPPSIENAPGWLLLVHQLPSQPAYERVKLRRRLQALGAVMVKKTVQALPARAETLEDFQWVAREIEAAGGDALVCEARLVLGITDLQLRAAFDHARELDYNKLAREARKVLHTLRGDQGPRDEQLSRVRHSVARLRKQLAEITAIDFFGAGGRESARAALQDVEDQLLRLEPGVSSDQREPPGAVGPLVERTWVTRQHPHVDRLACAWLIRRFIDPAGRLLFVDPATYEHQPGHLRYDMAEGEFTHRGDLCSFEVLLSAAGHTHPALIAIAEIVHDLDLKDGKFGRAEAAGVLHLIRGITLSTGNDSERVEKGRMLFDGLYLSLQRPPERDGGNQ